MGGVVLKLQAFKDSMCITIAHTANACHWALQRYRTPDSERVNAGTEHLTVKGLMPLEFEKIVM